MTGNGHLTEEQAKKILGILTQIDEGNRTIMTDSFGRFIDAYPDYRELAEKIYLRENFIPFNRYRGD